MKDIIANAVAEAFDLDSLGSAIADQVEDLIDYDDLARDLMRRAPLREAVQDAALSFAEDLL